MKARIPFLLLSFFCWFAQAAEPLNVSLIQLIARPNDYDGKVVRAIGFVRLEFEGNSIYLHQDDAKHSIHKNGLWLDVTDDIWKKKANFNQKHVLLQGTFNATNHGHFGLFSGSIEKISRFQVWSEKGGRK